jgi:hypothetical protein
MNNLVCISETEKTAQWLCAQTPTAVASQIAQVASQKGLKIDIDYRFEYPEGQKPRKIAACCRVVGKCENAPAMAHEVAKLMSPADKKTIKKWLVMLDAITAKKKESEATTDVSLEAYAQRLIAYPADIAKHVLIDMTWKFFPTWAELKIAADDLLGERKMVLHKLKTMEAPKQEPTREKTPEEKKSDFLAIDEILKNAGFTPKVAWTEDHNIYAKGD